MRNFALVIDLEKHIEILLLDNDCVIVPGLGGFVAHYIDARFDENSNMFLPPFRTLGFNSKLDMNDSLLAQSYVEAYDISYPEALRKIDSEVVELKRSLEAEGYYELDNIGVISVNGEGKYEFEPCEAGVLTPGLYGLVGTELQALGVEDVANDSAPLAVMPAAGVVDSSSSPLSTVCCTGDTGIRTLTADGTVDGNAASGTGERVISVRVSVLRNIVAVACAIVAFFVLATPISNGAYGDGKKMGNIGNGLLYNLIPKDGGVQNVKLSCDGSAKLKDGHRVMMGGNIAATKGYNGTRSMSETVAADVSVESEMAGEAKCNNLKKSNEFREKEGYCIVLACRITKSNAEAYVKQLHSKGYSEARLEGEGGSSLKVVYGNYSSEETALSELKSFRNKDAFKEAWIYHVK